MLSLERSIIADQFKLVLNDDDGSSEINGSLIFVVIIFLTKRISDFGFRILDHGQVWILGSFNCRNVTDQVNWDKHQSGPSSPRTAQIAVEPNAKIQRNLHKNESETQ